MPKSMQESISSYALAYNISPPPCQDTRHNKLIVIFSKFCIDKSFLLIFPCKIC